MFFPIGVPMLAVLLVISHTQYLQPYQVPGPPCTFAGVFQLAGEALRAIFTHADGAHLSGNVAALLQNGLMLEIRQGALPVTAIFLSGGMLGVMAWHTTYDGPVLYRGASPAVYALMTANVAHLTLNWKEAPMRLPWALMAGITLSTELIYSVFNPVPNVAYYSHLAGGMVGIFAGLSMLTNYVTLPWERTVTLVGSLGFLAFVGAAVWGAACDSYVEPSPSMW